MSPPLKPMRFLPIVFALMALAGCAQAPVALPPSVAGARVPAPPERFNASSAPTVAASAPKPASPVGSGVEAPRLIRGTDVVVGAAQPSTPIKGAPIDLRFEDSPVREVVHAILGDLLKLDYVLYPPVEGRVTLATASAVTPDLAVFLLEAALQANGLSMARDARGVYHVGKADAMKAIVPMVRQAGKEPLPPGQGAIVVPLRYIGAAEMATILRPMASADAIVRVDSVRNLLVLAGNRAQAEGWLSLVATFDIDLLAGMSVGVFPLKYATVKEVEAALQMMSAGGSRSAAAPGAAGAPQAAAAGLGENHPLFGAIRVLPMERLNSVVVVTPRAAYLDEARRWIERLDQPSSSSTEPRLHVYAVRNGSARHLGDVLNGIFGGQGQGTGAGATTSGVAPGLSSVTARSSAAVTPSTTPQASTRIGGTLGQSGLSSAGQSAVSGQAVSAVQLAGNVRVVADELSNAILVYGSTAQFERISEALRRLDTSPVQVLIEASIIEVTLTDDLKYGVQWLFRGSHGSSGGTGVLSTSDGGLLGGALEGFSYTLRRATSVPFVLNALAEKSLLRVISTPSLMVLDNHTASIVVGNQQPVVSGETVNADTGVRTTSIQYKDTGVSLSVTPSVGAGDMVTMNISQAVTDVGSVDGPTGQRSFLQRQIGSKVAVRSGETLVLGGLIRDNNSDGSSGLPLLHDIPVLGALFGGKSRQTNRTELLVLITPRVARSDEDAREISRALRERMQGLSGLQPGRAQPGNAEPPAVNSPQVAAQPVAP